MTPLSTVAVLFWLAVFSSALCMLSDGGLRALLEAHWKKLSLLLLLTLLWRIPPDGIFFHGLEYEDSYVYTVAGRQIYEHVGTTSAECPYSVNVCEVGSLKSCQSWESFPEHLIGYPYVISILSRALGYSASIGSVVNLSASCISVIFVFLVALLLTGESTAATLSGIVIAITPVFAVYGLETSAEPFSNTCIITVVWFYLRFCNSGDLSARRQIVAWIAYSTLLLFSQMVKREDILLAALFPIMLPWLLPYSGSKRLKRYTLVALVLLTSLFAVILSAKMHLLQTMSYESQLRQRFPMTAQHLTAFVISFLKSFLVTKWYGGTVLAVLAGVIVSCTRTRRALLPLVLLTAYILLYAVHIRSYYEMESGQIKPQAALRFSMNFMALWAIMAGLGISWLLRIVESSVRPWNRYKRVAIWSVGTAAAVLLAMAFWDSVNLRDYAVEDETISRVTPALSAIRYASLDDAQPRYVVTMEPLVIQMYASPSTRIVDLESVDYDTLQALRSPSGRSSLIFVKQADTLSDDVLNRYGKALQYMLSLPSTTLQSSEQFQIVSLNR